MRTLTEIFAEIGNNTSVDIGCNDKGCIHTYLETYDKLFAPFQKGCTMMEIGLAMGDSLKLWDEYFENSIIYGVDISIVFELPQYKNNIIVSEYDATKVSPVGTSFDIVIDDSSHVTQDQIDTFNLLKDKMKPGGLYIIEDLLALDIERSKYMALHENVEIVDMRSNGRFDNALCIIRF